MEHRWTDLDDLTQVLFPNFKINHNNQRHLPNGRQASVL
jgi:hypothetical protein